MAALSVELKDFFQSCMHCMISQAGQRIQRSLARALQRQKPNGVVQADFSYKRTSDQYDVKYGFLIENNLSSYTCLHSGQNACNDAATTALSRRIVCSVLHVLVTE